MRAEDLKQKAALKAAELGTQFDTAMPTRVEARRRRRRKGRRQGGRNQKGRRDKAAGEAKLALEPVSIYISRATQKLYVRRATRKPVPDGGEFSMRRSRFRSRSAIPKSGSARMCSLRWRATFGSALERGYDRRWGRRQERARPHHDPAGCARPRRADGIAATSIIVSDEPLSAETNYRTEFVAVLSNALRAASSRATLDDV